MKRIYTTTEEAQQVSEHDSGMFARLLSPQPPEGYELNQNIELRLIAYFDKDIKTYMTDNDTWMHMEIPLRYPSGDYVMYAPKRTVCHSKATSEEEVFTVPTKTNIKLSVATTVKRVHEFVNDTGDCLLYDYGWRGFACMRLHGGILQDPPCVLPHDDFINWWNANHAKPSMTADGLGYECFPYDEMSYWNICYDKYFSEVGKDMYYKGLPLKIYTNPWVELNAWRKE